MELCYRGERQKFQVDHCTFVHPEVYVESLLASADSKTLQLELRICFAITSDLT